MNKIEIITQHSDAAEKDPEHSAMAKLQELIEENPEHNKEEDDKDRRERKLRRKEKRQQREARNREATAMSPNPTIDDSNVGWSNKVVQDRGKGAEDATKSTTTTDKKLYKTSSSSSSSSSESDTNYDEDGFEIPPGKIPLDGHFSTEELELLVDIAKKEGILKNDVDVKVIGTSELFGDKVVLSEKQQQGGVKEGTRKKEEDTNERKGAIERKETNDA